MYKMFALDWLSYCPKASTMIMRDSFMCSGLFVVTFRDGTLRLVVWVANNRIRETRFKKTT